MTWRTFTVLLIVLAAAGAVYLISRFRRFELMKRISGGRRALSWLLAAIPVAAIAGFAFINVITMTVVYLHLILIWILCDLIGFLARKASGKNPRRYYQGAAALIITVLYLGSGWFFAHHVFRTSYAFTTSKDLGQPSLRVAAIADAHIGITLDGEDFARQMKRIQETDPDIVVIVGDFVDDDTDKDDMIAACRALGALDTAYGVYFVYGNHDNGYYNYRNFTSQELRAALIENHVTILEDKAILIHDSFYLIGRQDRTMPSRAEAAALTEGLDDSRYMIMLDHQPNDYAGEAASEADLVLSGHTHGGHIFPAGLIGLWMGANDRVYGTERRGNTDFIVTSGISGWGIPFKTGTISEYVIIDITME